MGVGETKQAAAEPNWGGTLQVSLNAWVVARVLRTHLSLGLSSVPAPQNMRSNWASPRRATKLEEVVDLDPRIPPFQSWPLQDPLQNRYLSPRLAGVSIEKPPLPVTNALFPSKLP